MLRTVIHENGSTILLDNFGHGMNALLQPVAASERIGLLDVLRGFALLGILLVNFKGEAGAVMPVVDGIVSGILAVFVSESFYPLFSFLFGVGFAVQLLRARERGSAASALYIRRMVFLFMIGTAHAVFVWGNDILVRYSIAGLLLIPLHRLSQKAIFVISLLMLFTILNGDAVRARAQSWRTANAGETVRELYTAEGLGNVGIGVNQRNLLSDVADPTYVQATLSRWKDYGILLRAHGDWLNWVLNDVLFCFLVGFMVGRARLLQEARSRSRPLIVTALVAFIIAASGIVVMSQFDLSPGFPRSFAWHAENFGMTAFLISTIALLFTFTATPRRVLSVFVAPGRMGLTIYLSQSLVMTWMSASYGFGWQPSTTIWIAVNLCFFFGVQVPFSRWRLRRFYYGPAEWLWRSLTYGRAQQLRVTPDKLTLERMSRASV
jgi:uncharacterized protein